MSTIVYRFGVHGAPLDNLELVKQQMRAAHNYANDLVAIERGRRTALHAIDDVPDVRNTIETVRQSTKSTRKAAITALRLARKAARAAAEEELARVQALDESIRRDARAITVCYWGSYLTIEMSAQQQRSQPLYEDDAITPNLPRFRGWREEGQIGIQIQKGLPTSAVRACTDTRARLDRSDRKKQGSKGRSVEYADLWIRIGSDGRAPIWTRVRVIMHRQIPDAAQWKWVRLSYRREGRTFAWSVEISVDVDRPKRTLDTTLRGAIAIEPQWSENADGSIVCATYRTEDGSSGEIELSPRIVGALRKADSIRAVRDMILNEARKDIHRALVEAGPALPVWLKDARNTMHLWKSQERFYRLANHWRRERCDAAREAYDRLQEWELRDDHLWRYEAGSRGQAIRSRNDFYHVIASQFARKHRFVIVPKRDYSREARFGAESDLRFIVSPSSLVSALDCSFDHGESAYVCPWVRPDGDGDSAEWPAIAIERFCAGDSAMIARKIRKENDSEEKQESAWARRKRLKREKEMRLATARITDGNGTKSLGQ